MEQTPQSSGEESSGEGAGEKPEPAEPPRRENIKETIESILVAFILAFVFRAFVVEAFVIPSGSMAPTLLGAHMRFRCQDCGYQFDVNYPTDQKDDTLSIPPHVQAIFSMHCPNCGYKVQRAGRGDILDVYYGDRILVLKYLYLIRNPKRWDVVVFKTPTGDFTQNYIKRLVGLPGEELMVLDGDVYVRPKDTPGPRGGAEGWKVQTKPRTVQEALWRVVHDCDFQPGHARPKETPWFSPWRQTAGAGWTIASGAGAQPITFNNPAGAGTLAFDRSANSDGRHAPYPLTDWLPYDETRRQELTPQALRGDPNDSGLPYYKHDFYGLDESVPEGIPRWYVSDLKLRFSYTRQSGEGPLQVRLSKLNSAFVAEFAPTRVRLLRYRMKDGRDVGVSEELGSAPLDGASGRPMQVEFSNADYRVAIRVNGKDRIATTPAQYEPDVADLLQRYRQMRGAAAGDFEAARQAFPPPSVSLTADKQVASLAHLSLWRDVYYTPGYTYGRRDEQLHAMPANPIRLHRAGEAFAKDTAGGVHENEYFVMGDNSVLSGDARQWFNPVDLRENENLFVEAGRVPERFLLGKAFFVYWPAGYRPFSGDMPGIIPNFGEMRLIH